MIDFFDCYKKQYRCFLLRIYPYPLPAQASDFSKLFEYSSASILNNINSKLNNITYILFWLILRTTNTLYNKKMKVYRLPRCAQLRINEYFFHTNILLLESKLECEADLNSNCEMRRKFFSV